MASQEAWDYAQPRSIELMRQWTVWMVVWTPLVMWRWQLEDATLILCGLMTVGVLMPLWYVERELKSAPFQPSGHLKGYGWAFTLFVFCSVMAPVQHDRSEPEKQVEGEVVALRWYTSSRDVGFSLAGDDTHYYINRGSTWAWTAPLGRRMCWAKRWCWKSGPTCRTQLVWVGGTHPRCPHGRGHLVQNRKGEEPCRSANRPPQFTQHLVQAQRLHVGGGCGKECQTSAVCFTIGAMLGKCTWLIWGKMMLNLWLRPPHRKVSSLLPVPS